MKLAVVTGLSVDVRLMMQTRAPQLHTALCTCTETHESPSPQTSHAKSEAQIDSRRRIHLASIRPGLDYVLNPLHWDSV